MMWFMKIWCVAFVIGFVICDKIQPELYVADGNLHITVPPNKYIQFEASKVKVNNLDVEEAINQMKSATTTSRYGGSSANIMLMTLGLIGRLDKIEAKLNGLMPENITNTTSNTEHIYIKLMQLFMRLRDFRNSMKHLQELLAEDHCDDLCQNGGTCLNTFGGFVCQCPPGWDGANCEMDIDECARYTNTDWACQHGGTCVNTPGSYQCQCINDWIGLRCTRKLAQCPNGGSEMCGHGVCVLNDKKDDYSCLCDAGWTTNGTNKACVVDVDECKQTPPSCNSLSKCINYPGGFKCAKCPKGYWGDGYQCVDANECALSNNGGCSLTPYVQCINTEGSSRCGPCPKGYNGNGVECVYHGICHDNNGGCSSLATCTDDPSIDEAYVKCTCPKGYTGSGVGIDGCIPSSSKCYPNPCLHGTCSLDNSTYLGFKCDCNGQYTGTYCDQQKRDPCASNPCMNGGTCSKKRKRFICTCLPGFVGRTCQREMEACGETFREQNGTLKYPPENFVSSGSESRSCPWQIIVNDTKVIEVSFKNFKFSKPPCGAQYLEIHDGNSQATNLGRFCGQDLPLNGTLTTTGNSIYLWLRSNGKKAGPEFELTWKTKDPRCGGYLPNEGFGMITSPGWPNKYPNNRNCYWRFILPFNKRMSFHVYALDIGQNSDCSGDYLEFSASQPPRLVWLGQRASHTFCNSTIPQKPFQSLGNIGLVHFKSNEKDQYGGFQIGYSVDDGIPGCGGLYTNPRGTIRFIDVTEIPLQCTFEINIPGNLPVKLNFEEFNIERTDNCERGYVAIYEKSDDEADLVGKYCGEQKPGHIITSGNTILIKSAATLSRNVHWKINYETICQSTFKESSGSFIISSGTGGCRYIIAQPPGTIIVLDVEMTGRSSHGTVQVYDGDNENATMFRPISGTKTTFESSTNYILIVSKNYMYFENLKVSYKTQNLGCGELLKATLGNIIYPPQPNTRYSGENRCRWVIMAPAGKIIELHWIQMSTEETYNCLFDSVTVYDNNTDIGRGGLLGKFCGRKTPPIMLSSSNIMTIDFVSDDSVHGEGFALSYRLIDDSTVCGGNYLTSSGIIKSPGFPNGYPTNKDCAWVVTVPVGSQIKMKITNFSIEASTNCRYDWLEIHNGGRESSPLVGKYCGEELPKPIISHTNQLYVRFHSDRNRVFPGFQLEWSSISDRCGGALYSPTGTIQSPNYPESYYNMADCLWTITISQGSKIQVYLTDIDLEDQQECQSDYIEIFDGPDYNSPLIRKICKQPSTPIISSKNSLTIRFRTDVSFQGRGFNLQYTTLCTNTFKGIQGVIESPNFPNQYHHEQNCTWEIIVPPGNKINVSFSHFDLEMPNTLNKSCTYDYIELEYSGYDYYDYESIDWSPLGRYCGKINPGLITIDHHRARVRFVTDKNFLDQGFRLEWHIFGCGGIYTESNGRLQSPNYPKTYPQNTECHWYITVPLGKSISLSFMNLELEKESNCRYDYLKIYNGKDDTYQELATICHQKTDTIITSSGNNMFIKMVSDQTGGAPGFSAYYTTEYTTCGGTLSAAKGNLYSPNYPKNYNANETCTWLISTDNDHRIELRFEDIDLIRLDDCKTNFIKIYDGPSEAYPVLETICGANQFTNKSIYSTSDYLTVEFRTHSWLTSKGFKAQYKKACGGKITSSSTGILELQTDSVEYMDLGGEPQSCNFTIQAEEISDHITLQFTRLDISVAMCYRESDGINIYDGAFSNSPHIKTICESRLPEPIVSDGNALHIEITTEIGFSVTYSVLDTDCGGTLYAEQGYIASPGWPKTYKNNIDCSWTINMGPGNKVSLNFLDLDIPESPSCTTDFVEIRDSNDTGTVLNVFCGTNSTSVSTTDTMVVIFKSTTLGSGIAGTNKGFRAEFVLSYGNELTGKEGLIGNVFYPNPTTVQNTMSYVINTKSNTVIELKFDTSSFVVPSIDCSVDKIMVYDGDSRDDPVLKDICTDVETVLSTSNVMLVTVEPHLRADVVFLLKWKQLYKGKSTNQTTGGCQFYNKITAQGNKTFTSPGYPNGYAGNLECEWIFEVDPQYHLSLKFLHVDLESVLISRRSSCTYADAIIVHSKASKDTEWTKLIEYCENKLPIYDPLIGKTMIKVEFRSNIYRNGTGFSGIVAGVCGGTLTESFGVIHFDKDHAYDNECQWNISVRAGRTIKVHFEQFDIQSSSSCSSYLVIRNGKFADSPFLGPGKFCGSSIPADLESTSNHLYLKYAGSQSVKGFKLVYTEVSYECGQNFRLFEDESSIEISSPNYPNVPQAHTECIWVISAPPGQRLRIDFEERVDISTDWRCQTDYLELRDGGTEIATLIERLCNEIPDSKYTTGNILRVKYFTDAEEPRNGFKANISIAYCGGIIRNGGMISSKSPHMLKAGSNCTWHLKSWVDRKLRLTFRSLNLGNEVRNCSDSDFGQIRIYEPSIFGENGTLLDKVCGKTTNHSSVIVSNTNEVIVNYLSKSDEDDFELKFSIIRSPCHHHLDAESGIITSPGYPVSNAGYCSWQIFVPKGRRITFIIEDIDIQQPPYSTLRILEDYSLMRKNNLYKMPSKVIETSGNTGLITFQQAEPSSKRGFKIRFNSDKPTICQGDFNRTTGIIQSPNYTGSYHCKYIHDMEDQRDSTLSVTVMLNTGITNRPNHQCHYEMTGIMLSDIVTYEPVKIFCRNTIHPVTVRMPDGAKLKILKNQNETLNYTISYTTFRCGGQLTETDGTISSPNLTQVSQSMECAWKIRGEYYSRIKINFTSFDLGDDCDKHYLIIYNGEAPSSPRIGKFCKNNIPSVIITERYYTLIEYVFVSGGHSPGKGFSLDYAPENTGCGGLIQSEHYFSSPNYGKVYNNNMECIWELQADKANFIELSFNSNFHIEESPNCTKDYLEILDWQYDKWVRLGKICGRRLPSNYNSTENQMRLIFRTDSNFTAIGFQANINWHCGGVFIADDHERTIDSPKSADLMYYPQHNVRCIYKIVSKRGMGIVRVNFTHFELTKSDNEQICLKANMTISARGVFNEYTPFKRTYCGRSSPGLQIFRNTMEIEYTNKAYDPSLVIGFHLTYKDESCGGNITKPSILTTPLLGNSKNNKFLAQGKLSCLWTITAPPDKIAVLKIDKLSLPCFGKEFSVYDGAKSTQLAKLCGNIEDELPITSISNVMTVDLQTFTAFRLQAEVYFTYGPAAGCGARINLTETTYINSPNNETDLDCHWTIIAPEDMKIELQFSSISISSTCEDAVRNNTNQDCSCAFIEVRDGLGAQNEMIEKLCSRDNNYSRKFRTSWNTAFVRLFSIVPQRNMFRLTLTPVQSPCGPSVLEVAKTSKELTSPGYPNRYPEDILCTWVIRNSLPRGKIALYFEDFDISNKSSSECDLDRFSIIENSNRQIMAGYLQPSMLYESQDIHWMGRQKYTYSFCDNTRPFEYYSDDKQITISFKSTALTVGGRGFKLKYGTAACDRTIHGNEGRIKNGVIGSYSGNICSTTIIADKNKTLSLFFLIAYMMHPNCSTNGIEIRENDQSGREISRVCGNSVPNPVFTNSSKLFIKAFSSGPSEPLYEFTYLASEKKLGCGGNLFNIRGKFTSPLYPSPYKEDTECKWDIAVPVGFYVALKFNGFAIEGRCTRNKLMVTTYDGDESSDHSFCSGDQPATLYSKNRIIVRYYTSVDNGGSGWEATFQATKSIDGRLYWT